MVDAPQVGGWYSFRISSPGCKGVFVMRFTQAREPGATCQWTLFFPLLVFSKATADNGTGRSRRRSFYWIDFIRPQSEKLLASLLRYVQCQQVRMVGTKCSVVYMMRTMGRPTDTRTKQDKPLDSFHFNILFKFSFTVTQKNWISKLKLR